MSTCVPALQKQGHFSGLCVWPQVVTLLIESLITEKDFIDCVFDAEVQSRTAELAVLTCLGICSLDLLVTFSTGLSF